MILLTSGTVLLLDSAFVSLISNFNFGVILPAILGLPLLLLGIFWYPFLRKLETSRFFRFLRVLLIVGYTLFTLVFVGTGTVLFASSSTAPPENADAVIVLGAGIHGDQVTRLLAKRLNAAFSYWESNPDTLIVVSGGQGPGETISEAEAMRRYLLSKGVPESSVLMEDAAASTQENFRFSKQLLDAYFGREYSTVYVTNDFHVFRAGLVAKKEGLTAHGLSSQSTEWYVLPNCYLRETAAVWAYLLLGWI